MNKQIVFTKVNTAELLDAESGPLNENQVKVKTLFHTMSNGTEKANITGDVRTVLELCAKGRLDLKSIVDETHSPTECAEVFDRLVNDKNFPNVVQFNWEDIHNA